MLRVGTVSRGWIRHVLLSHFSQQGLCQRGAGAQLRLCVTHALCHTCHTSSERLLKLFFGGDFSHQHPLPSLSVSPSAHHSGLLSVPAHRLPPTRWSPSAPFPLLGLLCRLTFLSHVSSTVLTLCISDRASSGHQSRAGALWGRLSPRASQHPCSGHCDKVESTFLHTPTAPCGHRFPLLTR